MNSVPTNDLEYRESMDRLLKAKANLADALLFLDGTEVRKYIINLSYGLGEILEFYYRSTEANSE
jgi:hypothetical protein